MNPIPHLQQLLMLALSIVLPKTELEQGESEGRIGEVTQVAIRRFLAEHRLAIPGGLEAQSPEWVAWIIRRLEAATQGRFIIFGEIRDQAEETLSGLSVRALDRELPSLERRGAAPQTLGETITDPEGRFVITYTLERFSEGEGIRHGLSGTVGRAASRSADLSFEVFDAAGQALDISKIIVVDQEFEPRQIIFNAPVKLDVSIRVAPRTAEGLSEYERLVALLAPIIKDIPLAELTDKDVLFILGETGSGRWSPKFGQCGKL